MIRPDSILAVNEKPRLKWVACHRGEDMAPLSLTYILRGPLRGCWRSGRSLFCVRPGPLTLEFRQVIRVDLVGDAEC